jgi:hypothetical protein
MDRPHTLVEISTGFLVLPDAQVCKSCQYGEFSLPLAIQNLYRWHAFAVGAGVEWATSLRTDPETNGAAALQRTHSRTYFLVEGQGRYYFIRARAWDWWAGASIGLVVVDDFYQVLADRQPYSDVDFIGLPGQTLGTVGFTLGAGVGGEWSFAPNWSVGPSLRYWNWFLPNRRAETPTEDPASLAGRLDAIELGIRIGYRLAL